ncbi:MAG TPA: hypothetical protein VMT86_12760 [Bryobacteraceae bacterium]|nr:hypothetical protein [Bryobacteraceae bacterium]
MNSTVDSRRECLAYALLAMLLVFSWQWLTVRVNYGGNWTALYCTGALQGVPATLAGEHVYQFPRSHGYDGQMYHYIAHDPLMRTPDLARYVDAQRMRYRRILIPGLAYLLAGGRAAWIDPAFDALIVLSVGAGVYWTAALARSPAWGLMFVMLPATLISIDRMTVDVALTAFAAGFAWHVRAPSWRLFVILAGAILTRETGLLLLIGWCGYLVLARRWKAAAVYATAAVPALVWYAYVHAHTPAKAFPKHLVPLGAIWKNFWHPHGYPPGVRLAWLAVLSDRLALCGMVLAFALAAYWIRKRWRDPVALATLCFVAMGVFLQIPDIWTSVYNFGRVYSPVLLFVGLESLEWGSWIALGPLALEWPRIGLQVGTQILGIFSATGPRH